MLTIVYPEGQLEQALGRSSASQETKVPNVQQSICKFYHSKSKWHSLSLSLMLFFRCTCVNTRTTWLSSQCNPRLTFYSARTFLDQEHTLIHSKNKTILIIQLLI